MPAPYALIDMPPGNYKDIFDGQAINMAAAHNAFIRGFNSITHHAPTVQGDKVKPFIFFCLTLLDGIHHHHILEETFLFPELEKKLGEGALQGNVKEHKEFLPGLEALDEWCKKVQKGEVEYDSKVFLELVEVFGDTMVAHLNSEIPTLDREIMKEKFTSDELKTIESEFMKLVLASIDYYTVLPLSMVCVDPNNLWFPPFPTVIKWATRWWFSWRHREAWMFGPTDFYGRENTKG